MRTKPGSILGSSKRSAPKQKLYPRFEKVDDWFPRLLIVLECLLLSVLGMNPSLRVVTEKSFGETHRVFVAVLCKSLFTRKSLSNYSFSKSTFFFKVSPIRSCSVIGLKWKPCMLLFRGSGALNSNGFTVLIVVPNDKKVLASA